MKLKGKANEVTSWDDWYWCSEKFLLKRLGAKDSFIYNLWNISGSVPGHVVQWNQWYPFYMWILLKSLKCSCRNAGSMDLGIVSCSFESKYREKELSKEISYDRDIVTSSDISISVTVFSSWQSMSKRKIAPIFFSQSWINVIAQQSIPPFMNLVLPEVPFIQSTKSRAASRTSLGLFLTQL